MNTQPTNVIPMVIESGARGERAFDIYSLLLRERIVMLGKRYALPNSTIHMHQAFGGAQGQAADVEIAAREIMRMQELIRGIIVKHTGQTLEKVIHDTDRDFYLNPEQAVEYGLVDEILTKPKDKKE